MILSLFLLISSGVYKTMCENNGSSYILIGSNNIRPNSEYKIAVQILKPGASLDIEANLGQSNDPGKVIVKGNGNFAVKNLAELLTLKVPNLIQTTEDEASELSLSILDKKRGSLLTSPLNNLQNSTTLQVNFKTTSIFVQTDKYKYKPGDKVRFRVVLVDSRLRPQDKIINVYINDPNGNRIKQWTNASLKTGVFGNEMNLVKKALLGTWIILMESSTGLSYSKNFEVEEYVLPTYDVKLIVPSYVVQRGNVITVSGSFEAKYTFGGSVPGKAVITLEDVYGYYQADIGYKKEKVQVNIDSKAGMGNFDLKLDLSKQPYINADTFTYGRPVTITINYLDSLTLSTRNASQDITAFNTAVKLSIAGPPYYKPLIPYTLKVTATQMDDKPLRPEDPHHFIVKSVYTLDKPENFNRGEFSRQTVSEMNYTLNADGVAYAYLNDLRENLASVDIQAYFVGDKRIAYHSAKRFDEPAKAYISLKLIQPNQEEPVKLGGVANFMVISNSLIPSISLVGVAKGSIVYFATISADNSTQDGFSVPITSEFLPNPTFVAFALYKDYIIADSIRVNVDRLTENRINITVDAEEKKPGEDAQFVVTSDADSLVCLLGVDKSVKLLAEGNDITKNDILNEIESYQSGGGGSRFSARRRRFVGGAWWWPSSGSSAKIFQDAGLFVLTDAKLHETVTLPIYYNYRTFGVPGPVAFSTVKASLESADRSGSDQSQVATRKEFPETWIWIDTYTDKSGKVTFKQKVPDTITTWVTTGFSINPDSGLAITDSPTNLPVVIPFFVTLNLPYSVVRGETVKVQAIVYNYLGQETQAQVTLAPHPSFELVPGASDKAQITVPSNSGASAYFTIKPLTVGNAVLKVTATSGSAGDSLEKLLLVKAEGETLYFNKPLFINVQAGKGFEEKVNITWDKGNLVPGSNHLEASAIGDIIGPSLSNIGNLIRMPYGCGEQNMLNFAPNIYIYLYLKARAFLNPQTLAKITSFTEQGYQRELTYQRNDGSFSAFGNSDPKGSVWLTGFVARSFSQAHTAGLIYIDPLVISKALTFIISQQAADGAFRETGEIHHKAMQGGASGGIALTAFVYLALKESQGVGNSSTESSLAQAMTKAENYMVEVVRSGKINDKPYELSIVAYALILAGNNVSDLALKTIKALATTTEGGNKYWKVDPTVPACPEIKCYYQPVSLDFEATSYVLLSYAKLKSLEEGLPVLRWLVSQRSSIGGYASTQDTIVAMQALSEYARLLGTGDQNVEISVAGDLLAHDFTITPANALVLDTFIFQGLENIISVSAKGTGTALIQISWSYNVANRSIPTGFEIDTGTRLVGANVQTEICYKYLGKGKSNMAIMEINSPSGFVFATDTSVNIQNLVKDIKLGEMDNGATKFNIYFTNIPDTRQCLTVLMNKIYDVQDLKKSLVKLSDYYQPELKGVAYICPNPSNTTKC